MHKTASTYRLEMCGLQMKKKTIQFRALKHLRKTRNIFIGGTCSAVFYAFDL